MRFISRYGRYGVQIKPQIQEAYATGMARVIQEPVYALFETGQLLTHERELALNTWTFNGFYQLEDEVSIMEPDYRIGLFDSRQAQLDKGWTDEIRLEVERELLRLCERSDDMIVVPETVIPPPWPRYDDYSGTPAALMRKLTDEGYELGEVLAYERANQNREKVVEALEQLIANPEPEREVEEVLG